MGAVAKPLPRYFALFAVALMVVSAVAMATWGAEESDAYTHGSQSSPLTSVNFSFTDLETADLEPYYVKVGSSVTIRGDGDTDDIECAISVNILSVTSGYGLTWSRGEKDPVSGYSDAWYGLVSGTITKAGTITIGAMCYVDNVSGVLEGSQALTIIAVADSKPVTSITINATLGSSTSLTMNSTVKFRAICSPSDATDMTVTWSLSNSNAEITRTWDDTYNGTYRNGVDVKGITPGTVVLTATANDGSGVTASKTLTINQYTYVIYFDANGGSGEPSNIVKKANDTTSTFPVTIPSTVPVRDGYTFLGWSTDQNAASPTYTAGQSVTLTYDGLDLYAVWQVNKQNFYAYLHYNANGGSGAPDTQSDSIYASSVIGTGAFTVSSVEPTRQGYMFLGWSEDRNATSPSYQPDDTIHVPYDGSKTLYAVWQVAEVHITSEPPAGNARVNQPWSYTPTVDTGGCTVSVSGADWLSANDGTVGGTPKKAGTYNVTVTVSKTGYTSDVQTFTLKVDSALGFGSAPRADGLFAYAE